MVRSGRLALLFTTLFCLGPAGISAQQPAYPLSDAPEHLRPGIAKAEAVFGELQKALLSTLGAELNAGGPARALSTCHSEAARIADRVTAESGIKVGRTSQRLRNPRNLAPGWAHRFVADGNDRKAADARAMAVDLGDRVGVLRPIATAPLCTNCHGPENALSQEVRDRLRALYPGDRGVGFQPGDLRGWMWAEVPLKK